MRIKFETINVRDSRWEIFSGVRKCGTIQAKTFQGEIVEYEAHVFSIHADCSSRRSFTGIKSFKSRIKAENWIKEQTQTELDNVLFDMFFCEDEPKEAKPASPKRSGEQPAFPCVQKTVQQPQAMSRNGLWRRRNESNVTALICLRLRQFARICPVARKGHNTPVGCTLLSLCSARAYGGTAAYSYTLKYATVTTFVRSRTAFLGVICRVKWFGYS